MAFKLKMDEEKKQVVLNEDGQPVFLDDDGNEYTFAQVQEDWGQKFASVNREAGEHRKAKAAIKKKLEAWEGLGKDLDEVKEMIDKFADIDLSKLSKAEEVKAKIEAATAGLTEKMQSMKKSYDKKIEEYEGQVTKLESNLKKLVISNSFAANPFFNDSTKTLMTPDMAELLFGNKFRVEDGKAVCYPDGFDDDGEPLGPPMYSHQDPGQTAAFEEAVQHLWESYPHKDRYTPPSGGGDHQRGDRTTDKSGKNLLELAAEAQAEGDVQKSIALKNQYFREQQGSGPKAPPEQQ